MTGEMLLVLLLATGVGQADKKSGAEHAAAEHAAAAKTQAKTEAVKGQKEAQSKTKAAHERTAEPQAEMNKQQGQAEAAQVKTEAGQTQDAQPQTEEAQPETDKDGKLTSVPGGKALGMSILGNQEAPTSLVIVPWKSSEVGRATGISPMLDDSRQPVDKEVFMRELRYYEIRSEKKP
jgi:hypothetical protein